MGHNPSAQELARLAAAAPIGIMISLPDGTVGHANACLAAILGYADAAEIIGLPVIALLAPEDLDARPLDPTRVKPGQPAHNERLMVRKDGSRVWVKSLTDHSEDGRFLFWLWDMSEHQRLETELREAQKLEAVGLLAAGVAHDLNNLLAVVNGHAELLRGRTADDASSRSLGYIVEAASRAADLTHKLLAFGRRQVLQPQQVLLSELVEKNKSLLTSLAGDDVALRFELADHALDWVEVDPGPVEQALWNLVTNARQAMPQGGQLTISTHNVALEPSELAGLSRARPDARFVALSVQDSGVGMDEATLRRVFEPFFTTKALGTGLGLSVVHGVVGQSGGLMRVRSAPGHGSRFEMCFPRVEFRASQVHALEPPAPRVPASLGPVLVVEDDAQIRSWLVQALTRRGLSVESAPDAECALATMAGRTEPPSAVITDVHMTGKSGPMLVAELRARWPSLPVVFMTGYAEAEAVRAMPIDSRLLRKPFTTEQALDALRGLLPLPG